MNSYADGPAGFAGVPPFAAAAQKAGSEPHDDHRPPGERTAAVRYSEPSLSTVMETALTR